MLVICSCRLVRSLYARVPSAIVLLALAVLGCRSSGDAASLLGGQRQFATPDAAAAALIDALQRGDTAETRLILGPAEQRLFERSGFDGVAREALVRASGERLQLDDAGDGCVFLRVGADGWRFPIPLLRDDERWTFVVPETSAACARLSRAD